MTSNGINYEIKERSATEVTLQVTVEPPIVRNEIDTIYSRYGREVEIPGFRKGHVPRGLLDSRFGREMFLEEAQKELTEEHLPKALSELSLHPVTLPQAKTISFEESEPFVFEASFSVLPQFDLPVYRGIELTVEPVKEVTDDSVHAAVEEIRRQYGTLSSKKGDLITDGDIVHVQEGEEEWDTRAEMGNPVTEKLIGHKIGETVKIELDLPGSKPVHTSLSILGLKEIVLPEVDDELAKDAGFESLVALEVDVTEKLKQAHVAKRERVIKVNLLDHLIDQVEIPLPQALVEEVAEEEFERLKKNLSHPRSPLSFEDYLDKHERREEEVRADYREIVTRRIRHELLLKKIAEKEEIAIEDEELERIATEEAASKGEAPLRFIARLKAEERWDDYRTEKVNERVLDLLYQKAQLTKEEK